MDSFKDYHANKEAHLEKMSPEKHVEKLDKTRKSIITHKKYGGNVNQRRGYDLVDRYNDHANALKKHHPEHWKEYNKSRGSDSSHDAYDLYA